MKLSKPIETLSYKEFLFFAEYFIPQPFRISRHTFVNIFNNEVGY